MSKERAGPRLTEETRRLAAEREARLAARLRGNLVRRKAQARRRAEAGEPAPESLEETDE